METDQTTEGNQPFVAHVPVPSQKEVCTRYLAFLFVYLLPHLLFTTRTESMEQAPFFTPRLHEHDFITPYRVVYSYAFRSHGDDV